MKKLLMALMLLASFSCKKEDPPQTTPPPAGPPPPPAHKNTMTATVNGHAWAVKGNGTNSAQIIQNVYNGTPKQYVIGGRTDSTYSNSISLGFAPATGTFDLVSFTNIYASYHDTIGFSYSVKSGTINIIAIDTSRIKSNDFDKFKATFSFTTNPILGVSYTVTNGSIDFEAK